MKRAGTRFGFIQTRLRLLRPITCVSRRSRFRLRLHIHEIEIDRWALLSFSKSPPPQGKCAWLRSKLSASITPSALPAFSRWDASNRTLCASAAAAPIELVRNSSSARRNGRSGLTVRTIYGDRELLLPNPPRCIQRWTLLTAGRCGAPAMQGDLTYSILRLDRPPTWCRTPFLSTGSGRPNRSIPVLLDHGCE